MADNVKASGVVIPAELLTSIDEILGDQVERDAKHTYETSPKTRVV